MVIKVKCPYCGEMRHRRHPVECIKKPPQPQKTCRRCGRPMNERMLATHERVCKS